MWSNKFISIFLAVFLCVLTFLSLVPGQVNASAQSWWNSGWSRRVPITITEKSGVQLNEYQVKIVVPYDPDMKSKFEDIRFIDRDNTTELPFWMEDSTDLSAAFWVKVPTLPASGTAGIFMYFGNPSASAVNDIHKTFIFGDDFSDPDWTKANIQSRNFGKSRQSVQDGEYHQSGPGASMPIAEVIEGGTLKEFPANYVTEIDVQPAVKSGAVYLSTRYSSLNNKYEPAVDLQNDTACLSLTVNKAWNNLRFVPLGYRIEVGDRFVLKTSVSKEGNVNRLQVYVNDNIYIDCRDPALSGPGVAFLTYSPDEPFDVAYDNLRVRQYASQEPLVSLGTKAQSSGKTFSWWNSAWTHRALITVTEYSGKDLIDFQVKVNISWDPDMKPYFADIRFVDADQTTQLSYWLEPLRGPTAIFWVKIPFIPASGVKTMYMYYGNPLAAGASDVHNTFIFGDDFEDGRWTRVNIHPQNYAGGLQQLKDGEYVQSGSAGSLPVAEIYQGAMLKQLPSDYVVEIDVNPFTKTGGAFIATRYAGTTDNYQQLIDIQNNGACFNETLDNSWNNEQWTYMDPVLYSIVPQRWYTLKAVTAQEGASNRLKVYVNNALFIDRTNADISYSGLAFLTYDWNDAFQVSYDNFRVRQYTVKEPVSSIVEKQTIH
jgi:hypothetical protein